jgi:hypothetical protein
MDATTTFITKVCRALRENNHVYWRGCICDEGNQLVHTCLEGTDINHLLEDQVKYILLLHVTHEELVDFFHKNIKKAILKRDTQLLEDEKEIEDDSAIPPTENIDYSIATI